MRKSLCHFAFAGIMLVIFLGPAPARAGESPTEFVSAFLEEAIGLFRAEAMTEERRRAALRDLFTRKMDLPRMARFMTMDQVIEAEPGRRHRFEGLLAGYLVDSFYPKIAERASASINVTESSQSAGPDNPVVNSIVMKSGSPPEPITWRLNPAGGSYKIVDVISNGMSLATTYRDVFGSVILSGGLQHLEAMLAARQ